MQTKSLKVLSCLEFIRHNNLSLADIFDPKYYFLDEYCANDQFFWKSLLIREYGNLVLLSRFDINNAELLRAHAEALKNGDENRYTIVGDWGINEIVVGPELYDEYNTYEEEFTGDEHVIHFTVPGLEPRLGSIGYVIRFYFDNPIRVQMSEPRVFLCMPEQLPETITILKEYIHKNFLRVYEANIIPQPLTMDGINMDHPTLQNTAPILNRIMLDGNINLNVFLDDGRLQFIEGIIDATNAVLNANMLAMFLDIGQLRF